MNIPHQPNDPFRTPMEFDLALLAPVRAMMSNGIRMDMELRKEKLEEAHVEWAEVQEALNSVAGRGINVNSSPQVQQFLYKDLGLPPRTKDKRITADEDALRSLFAYSNERRSTAKRAATVEKYERAALSCFLIIKIRAVRKKISSFLQVKLDSDGRARCTISVGGTRTFRFSHSKTLWDTGLNLATVPRSLRTMFIADEGCELAEFDLNRGESWVYAHLSDDEELIRIHREGLDFHSITAATVASAFGESPPSIEWIVENREGDSYKLRYLGKKINHASAYRMGYYRAAEIINSEADDTGITVVTSQTKNAQTLWKWKYPGIPAWWREIEHQLATNRTMVTPYGRVCQFPFPFGDKLYKEATAYVPQSTSVDYLNRGMLRVFNTLCKNGPVDLLHQNHDSILVQYPIEIRDEVVPQIIHLLQSTLVVNGHEFVIPVEGSYGPNWKEMSGWE